jgi:uncharacterized protein (TIGR03083 family)
MSLMFEAHLDAIAEELERFEVAARDQLDLEIPTCPGWSVRRLSGHLYGVFERWAAQVRAADADNRTAIEVVTPSDDDELLAGVESAAVNLLSLMTEAGPVAECWNFFGEETTVAWLARRIALELAIHRVDAELAFGGPTSIERELAVEGVEERMEFFMRARVNDNPDRTLGGTLCLICDDDEAAWVVEVERGGVRWRRGRGPADAALVGSASDLFLFSWNRIPASRLALTGDRDVADAWAAIFA